MLKQKFDPKKALETLLYIAAKCSDMYTALKVLYFADKKHLQNYGRLICGENYIAMNNGPVPGHVYDMVKAVRGDGFCSNINELKKAFTVENNKISVLRSPKEDYLSPSDIECLDISIKNYGKKSFKSLKNLSHDSAFEAADRNDSIPIEALIKSLPDSKQLLDYYKSF